MTLVVVPFCAMLAPCSMLSRTPRAAPKERGAGSKIPLDNPSPIQGLELRYPDTSQIFEMSMITVVGSAETRQQRLFAFELRRWGTRARAFCQDHRAQCCAVSLMRSNRSTAGRNPDY
jgi:hypothetical protein